MRIAPTMFTPSNVMMEMITGYWVTQIVGGAARYELADCLALRSMTASEFADAQGLDRLAVGRFLRACAAIGLVRFDGRRFSATELLETLRDNHPHSLRGFALAMSSPGHWLPWGRFAETLITGERQTLVALGAEIFDYFEANPEEGAAFTDAMSGMTAAVAAEVSRLLDTTQCARAVDVGGAAGAMLFPLLRANPRLKGVVFDLPNVTPSAVTAAQEAGLGDRVEAVAGNFFESVPEGDLYLLKYILHDWDDASCVTILRNAVDPCGRAGVLP